MSEVTEATRESLRELQKKPRSKGIIDYITVLKPRETVLLAFIGVCAAIIAAQGNPPLDVLGIALVAIVLGSAGANGLTNYLDRNVDARMTRTHLRALPAERIIPAKRALVWSIFLILVALAVAWYLDPLCFVFGLVGTVAASVFRKRVMCVIQGGIAGCAPVLIGYVAVTHRLDMTILFLCIFIVVWIPLHVWSVMIANREDYLQAGVEYFPVTWKAQDAVKVLMVLAVLLYAASIALWAYGNFGWLYFAVANILSMAMLYANFRLLRSVLSRDAWKVYKLSAFPYLGLIFIALCLNFWV
ncbi:MAG TPA: protoheme IX farnesyltransferase [Dehalococcoidia bacterium]|nr:protoheme IX farnesyltransferase [Dehalococcoidia bacterium]